MQNLKLFSEKEKKQFLKKRKGELKFGQHIKYLTNFNNIQHAIENLEIDYVIFGICEDIGVYANQGKTGTKKAWEATLNVLLNIQSNTFTKANRVLILGCLTYKEQQKITKLEPEKQTISKARSLVETIDNDVSYLVSSIVKAGKTPIIIGGGHNNAYGNIKGTALANVEKINVVNFDAHTDFRAEEGRHSGNGFSYAFSEGFLEHYFVFGLHENYTSDELFKHLNTNKYLKYNTYEAIAIRNELDFKTELELALNHVSDKKFGIEIDCDAIENIPSSAMTPSGFSTTQARQFVNYFGKHKNANYLHICEAAPTKKTATKVGKLITYLITDFIRANGN